MAKKDIPTTIPQSELDRINNFTKNLPQSALEMVPDDANVNIVISGYFFRNIVKTLDHVIATSTPSEVMRATEYLKLEYDETKGVNKQLITSLDTAIWTLSNLISEYNVQGRLQKKTKVYDKTAVGKFLEDTLKDPANMKPLTTKELEKRQEMEKLAKEKKDKEESNED